MVKRRYLLSGKRDWKRSKKGKISGALMFVLRSLFKVARLVVFGIFIVISKLPFISKLFPRKRKSALGWANVFATSVLALLIIGILSTTALFAYYSRDLPSPGRLINRELPLSTKIFDRNGNLLFDVYGEENRTWIPLEEIPDHVKWSTIAMEDQNFYKHQGFDLLGIVRAARNTLFRGKLEGGSTLTQQLVKNTLLTRERTLTRKVKELILSIQIERKFTKDEILELYLNEVPYGGTAWGVEAASQMYFGKSVKEITISEAALLAGLPNAPSKYSPYRDPQLAKWRQEQVLRRMVEDGYITDEQSSQAKQENLKYAPKGISIRAPHFVMYVKELLEERYGSSLVERGGLQVTTSLDLGAQDKLQKIVKEEVDKAKNLRLGNGALVAADPSTGEILAMVGSKDYFDDVNDGKFNVVLALRQPGSSIKPITYVTAFKQGYTPATVLFDVPTEFSGGAGQPPYNPVNYDDKFRGPLLLRKALGNSINITAVKLLYLVGLENMMGTARDMGITTFNDPSRYGLSLTLGGGEVKLMDMVTAFSVFSTGGIRHDPIAILKVTDSQGNVLEEFHPTKGVRVLTEEQTYLINDILSDAEARMPAFGGHAAYNILGFKGYTVAVKTGTSNDKRDNWTIGYTSAQAERPVVVGVWTGNNDNSPMHPRLSSGITGAAPIWHRAMAEVFLPGRKDAPFTRPEGIVEASVDALSGKLPGTGTGQTITEIFIKGTVPAEKDDFHRILEICKPDGKLASDACRKAGKTENITFTVLKAALPEWQGFVDAWRNSVYPKDKFPEYYPPTDESTLCFDNQGNVVGDLDCKPLVEVISPSQGEEVDEMFVAKAKVTIPAGVAVIGVEFWVDGACFKKCGTGNRVTSTDAQGIYELEIDLTGEEGEHNLIVKAYDSKGGVGQSEVVPFTTGSVLGSQDQQDQNEGEILPPN